MDFGLWGSLFLRDGDGGSGGGGDIESQAEANYQQSKTAKGYQQAANSMKSQGVRNLSGQDRTNTSTGGSASSVASSSRGAQGTGRSTSGFGLGAGMSVGRTGEGQRSSDVSGYRDAATSMRSADVLNLSGAQGGTYRNPLARGLMSSVSQIELGPWSDRAYSTRYGGNRFDYTKGFPSGFSVARDGTRATASGAYQINDPTYRDFSKRMSIPGETIKGFTPDIQDEMGWEIAKTTYDPSDPKALLRDLADGKIDKVTGRLNDRWPSLPGGSQQREGAADFRSRFERQYLAATEGSPSTAAERAVAYAEPGSMKNEPGQKAIDAMLTPEGVYAVPDAKPTRTASLPSTEALRSGLTDLEDRPMAGLIEAYGPMRPNTPSSGIQGVVRGVVAEQLGEDYSVRAISGQGNYGAAHRHPTGKALDYDIIGPDGSVVTDPGALEKVATAVATRTGGSTGYANDGGYMGRGRIHSDFVRPSSADAAAWSRVGPSVNTGAEAIQDKLYAAGLAAGIPRSRPDGSESLVAAARPAGAETTVQVEPVQAFARTGLGTANAQGGIDLVGAKPELAPLDAPQQVASRTVTPANYATEQPQQVEQGAAEPEQKAQRSIPERLAAGAIDVGVGFIPGVGTAATVFNLGAGLLGKRTIGQRAVDLVGDSEELPASHFDQDAGSNNRNSSDNPPPLYPREERVATAAPAETFEVKYLGYRGDTERPSPQDRWGRRSLNFQLT